MKHTEAQRRRTERGSALLLTILLTLVGAMFLGLAVDAMSLVWVRSNAQTTANLVAAAVALEQQRHPAATTDYLLETARSTAALNGYTNGVDAASVRLEQTNGKVSILVERDAGVYFLRAIRPQPVAVAARAGVEAPAPQKAGL